MKVNTYGRTHSHKQKELQFKRKTSWRATPREQLVLSEDRSCCLLLKCLQIRLPVKCTNQGSGLAPVFLMSFLVPLSKAPKIVRGERGRETPCLFCKSSDIIKNFRHLNFMQKSQILKVISNICLKKNIETLSIPKKYSKTLLLVVLFLTLHHRYYVLARR